MALFNIVLRYYYLLSTGTHSSFSVYFATRLLLNRYLPRNFKKERNLYEIICQLLKT
jgi:hypothetical protein